MSTHNIYFCQEIKKKVSTFGLKKSALSEAMRVIRGQPINKAIYVIKSKALLRSLTISHTTNLTQPTRGMRTLTTDHQNGSQIQFGLHPKKRSEEVRGTAILGMKSYGNFSSVMI